MYKIIGADGKEYGPVTADQVRDWIAQGRANANTRVQLQGATEWKLLADIPEFGPNLAGASTPPLSGAPTQPSLAPTATAVQYATDQVSGPAIGLIVTAILGFLVQAASLLINLAGISMMQRGHMGSDPWVALFSGPVAVASSLVCMLVSVVILLGALKMKKLESYGLAMVASVLAAVPCVSPCCLLGLPIGIWAIVILMKPEVKNAFH